MKAQLVYDHGEKTVLEEMDLKELDQFTHQNFSSIEDVFGYPKYQKFFSNSDLNGSLYIDYYPLDMSLSSLTFYPTEEYDTFSKQKLDVIYSGNVSIPDQMNFLRDIRISWQENNVLSFLHDLYAFSLDEIDSLYYYQGLALDDFELCTKGFERTFRSMFSGEEGYFYTRFIRNEIQKFLNIEKKQDTK